MFTTLLQKSSIVLITSLSLAACGGGGSSSDSNGGNASAAEPRSSNSGGNITHSPSAIPGSYIVTLRSQAKSDDVAALAREVGGTVTHRYSSALQGFTLNTNLNGARQLAAHSMVSAVEENGRVGSAATQFNPSWGLDRIDQRETQGDRRYNYNATGQGVHVYVIDTGIRASHSDFRGRIGASYSANGQFATGSSNASDCHGHGTHVAGIIGGTLNGVAKSVTLHAVQVLDCRGTGSVADVLAGIDWVSANHQAPAVANLSLNGSNSPAMDRALRQSVNNGVFYAVAAGNNAANACGGSPNRVAEVMTVGASTQNDQAAHFSNHGQCVDIWAPGVSISSAGAGSDVASSSMSGSSMAAPHVAGVAALYRQAHPRASSGAVFSALLDMATQNVLQALPSGSPNYLLHSIE